MYLYLFVYWALRLHWSRSTMTCCWLSFYCPWPQLSLSVHLKKLRLQWCGPGLPVCCVLKQVMLDRDASSCPSFALFWGAPRAFLSSLLFTIYICYHWGKSCIEIIQNSIATKLYVLINPGPCGFIHQGCPMWASHCNMDTKWSGNYPISPHLITLDCIGWPSPSCCFFKMGANVGLHSM